jgi:hypothetical protein
MVSEGLVSTRAYSLWLNDYASDSGSILFGGIDTDKFIGELRTVDILPDSETGNYTSFTVGMSALSLEFANGTDPANISLPSGGLLNAVLDSGTTLSYFPDDVATPLFEALGAYTYTEDSQALTLVDCNLLDSDQTFTLRIGFAASEDDTASAVTIAVPADELVLDVFAGQQDLLPTTIPFESTCLLGVQNSGDALPSGRAQSIEFALLGDTFLRSAYVVFDQTNSEILMAQYENCGQDEQAIPTGSSGASSFTGGCGSGSSSSSSSEDSGSKNAGVRTAGSVGFAVAAVAGLAMLMNTL